MFDCRLVDIGSVDLRTMALPYLVFLVSSSSMITILNCLVPAQSTLQSIPLCQGLASPLLAMYAGTDVVELTPANFQKEV